MKNKLHIFLLGSVVLLSVFFHFYKSGSAPVCLNADEAAFGYNAFSILKTGSDEHGAFLPLRLQSFNDFKLPLYSYLSIPFVGMFGLSEFSIRLLNKLIGILLVPLMYFVVLELFKKRSIALVASVLTAVTPWIFILSRHAHEGVLSAFFVLLGLLFLLRFQKNQSLRHVLFANVALILSTFSYHTGRLFLVLFIGYQIILLMKLWKKKLTGVTKYGWIGIIILALSLPFAVDSFYGANRVQNLLFNQTGGFQKTIDENLREHPSRLFHNKGVQSVKTVTRNYFSQISPEFFLNKGDENPRFGFDAIGLITPVEYALIFVGFYFLFKRKEKYRWLLGALFFITPLGNALTWQNNSLLRTYFLIFIIIAIVSYGFNELFAGKKRNYTNITILSGAILLYMFFLLSSWDAYLNHYFDRAITQRSWQCGYKELVTYVDENYDRVDRFFITSKHGQPYIYLLFFNQMHPDLYRETKNSTRPDEYGFTQVKEFDKFKFSTPSEILEGSVLIGYPDDFNGREYDASKVKKITIHREEIFWIYEP